MLAKHPSSKQGCWPNIHPPKCGCWPNIPSPSMDVQHPPPASLDVGRITSAECSSAPCSSSSTTFQARTPDPSSLAQHPPSQAWMLAPQMLAQHPPTPSVDVGPASALPSVDVGPTSPSVNVGLPPKHGCWPNSPPSVNVDPTVKLHNVGVQVAGVT